MVNLSHFCFLPSHNWCLVSHVVCNHGDLLPDRVNHPVAEVIGIFVLKNNFNFNVTLNLYFGGLGGDFRKDLLPDRVNRPVAEAIGILYTKFLFHIETSSLS